VRPQTLRSSTRTDLGLTPGSKALQVNACRRGVIGISRSWRSSRRNIFWAEYLKSTQKTNLQRHLFATLHQSLPVLGVLRWRFTSNATILAILTIFSGVNHVDGTPPALAPSAKLV
jgi:hypothetical protein